MIEPFKGELMLHPCALDYNGNQCSNRCAYCFANSRNACRRGNPRTLVDLVLGRSRMRGLARFLFDAGYAVCMSNRTDPLSAANEADSAVAFAVMNDAPNGLLVQTKGGGAHRLKLLDGIKKKNVCLYVTVTSRDDAILRRVEPGASSYCERLELAAYAHDRGWAVIVGLNPLWRPWMPLEHLEDTVIDFREAGARDFLVQPLHISRTALANMPPDCRRRLTDEELSGAASRSADTENGKHFVAALQTLKRLESSADIRWMPVWFRAFPSHMLDAANAALGKSLRSTQRFIDFAAESSRRFFTVEDWIRELTSGGNEDLLEYGASNVNGYLFTCNRGAWQRSTRAKSAYTFRDVYREIWNNAAFSGSPQNVASRFCPIADGRGDFARDANGDLILAKTEYEWKTWEKK